VKVLITGGSGQVGFELQRQFCCFGTVLAPTRQQLDLASGEAVAEYLSQHQPTLILNAAAYTAVDNAESEPQQASRLNSELPAQLAGYAAKHDAMLVHYSSDYVYGGNGQTPWQEDDAPAPLNVYGVTKLAGDNAVLASGCKALILRTSWVYSARGANFMRTMLRLGQARDSLSIVNDQVGAPTPARLIALLTQMAVARQLTGLFHVVPRGETTWHDFAQAIFQHARACDVALAVQPEKVVGIETQHYPTPAKRPLNSRLSVGKLEDALSLTLPSWQQQLALTLDEALMNAH